MDENYGQQKWTKEQIKSLLIEQFQSFWQRDLGIEREQLYFALVRTALLYDRKKRSSNPTAVYISQALILTDSNAPAIEEDGQKIEIRSAVEWLLDR